MARSTSAQTVQASATNTAGSTTGPSSAFAIGYGVSGKAKITNGATGPTVACDFVVEFSNDGGTTWFEIIRQTSALGNNVVSPFPFNFAPGGKGGDWTHYRTTFVGNTGQSVTVQADACTTTAY